jgi:hypothetical protein
MVKREPTFGFSGIIRARFGLTRGGFALVCGSEIPSRAADRAVWAMNLRELVEKYRAAAGAFGRPLPLAAFALARPETERLFGVFDEDYHISRFFHLSLDPALQHSPDKVYQINGFAQSHVSIDAAIEEIL